MHYVRIHKKAYGGSKPPPYSVFSEIFVGRGLAPAVCYEYFYSPATYVRINWSIRLLGRFHIQNKPFTGIDNLGIAILMHPNGVFAVAHMDVTVDEIFRLIFVNQL